MDVLLDGGAVLQQRDYTLIIDQSQSMSVQDYSEEKRRWDTIQESTLALATRCEQLDPDGITVYLFSENFKRYEKVTSDQVVSIFKNNEPSGKPNLAAVLKDATDHYFQNRAIETAKPNGETMIIVTGGEIEHSQSLKQIIIDAANQLSWEEELGIELIQVGSDPKVTQLFKVLDHDLQQAGAKFDICNTITFEDMAEMSLTDILLKAIAS